MEIGNIKFKAKKTLDGKWIKGDLVHHKDSDNVWITDYENQLTSPVKYNVIRDRKYIFKEHGKVLTHVLFINGYNKDSPRIEKEIESITIGKPKKGLCPDKWLDTEFFIIKFK